MLASPKRGGTKMMNSLPSRAILGTLPSFLPLIGEGEGGVITYNNTMNKTGKKIAPNWELLDQSNNDAFCASTISAMPFLATASKSISSSWLNGSPSAVP